MKQGPQPKRAVFLDRDGTVSEEVGYMYDVSRLRVFPWTGPAIRRINDSGLYAILATNQSGVARGYFGRAMVDRVHGKLAAEIRRARGRLDAAYFCPHAPEENCECRKPKPGLLFRARDDLAIDLGNSYMIGDRYTDLRAGIAAGTRTILVMTGDGRDERARHHDSTLQPDHVAETLSDAVDFLLRDLHGRNGGSPKR
jgi:D-glycero-D-manno-heptose 1,7-bisphosphate phosphatase